MSPDVCKMLENPTKAVDQLTHLPLLFANENIKTPWKYNAISNRTIQYGLSYSLVSDHFSLFYFVLDKEQKKLSQNRYGYVQHKRTTISIALRRLTSGFPGHHLLFVNLLCLTMGNKLRNV